MLGSLAADFCAPHVACTNPLVNGPRAKRLWRPAALPFAISPQCPAKASQGMPGKLHAAPNHDAPRNHAGSRKEIDRVAQLAVLPSGCSGDGRQCIGSTLAAFLGSTFPMAGSPSCMSARNILTQTFTRHGNWAAEATWLTAKRRIYHQNHLQQPETTAISSVTKFTKNW